MKVANEAVQEAGKISEGTICYTGDILNPERSDLYTLEYYVNMAKTLNVKDSISWQLKIWQGY